ncbi:MAG: asparagine synthase (glutamine-hydrolyzing) [Syntrophobacteraceae bacterium]|nr:asparagine synthase (glutamine-hydrolyzing) [Desulfobacteraceae bacterium]
MCGICGVLHFDPGTPVDPIVLARITRSMTHRGPDEEGFYLGGSVGLGHRRLAILDLLSGRQPIHNEDETVWIVFNGEIYNAPELRRDLEGNGHRFYTQSDTEVIVHAYEQYGPDCLGRLNGIFALAVWEKERRRLFLARDRAGVKPLYYADLPGGVAFGSELKAILAHPAVERRLDPVSLNQYLSYEYVPSPRTIFQGVSKLSPGHCLTIEKGRCRLERYWDLRLEKSERLPVRSTADYVDGFRNTLDRAVRLELLSDVPVGVMLSGGLDSSAVAAAMVRSYSGRVRSFSITFDDPSFDESQYARMVSRHLGTEHHELPFDSRTALGILENLGESMDEPNADSSWIPTMLLSRFASGHVKVALSGDGGDELFGGYPTLPAHLLAKYYQSLVPAPIRRRVIPWLVDRLPVSMDYLSLDFKLRRFLTGQSEAPEVRHHIWMGSFTEERRRALLRDPANVVGVEEVATAHAEASGASHLVNRILYCDLKLFLEGCVLPKVDRTSMACSLEVRPPLLNHLFLEYAGNLPHHLKLRGLTGKYLMRRALEGFLPSAILKRGKKGFNMPMGKWLLGPLRPLAEEFLSERRLERGGLFDPGYVRGLWKEHLAGIRDNRKMLWTLLAFELWRERWMH